MLWKDEGTSLYVFLGDACMNGLRLLLSTMASIPPWAYLPIALFLFALFLLGTYLWPILETTTDESQSQTD